jgi:hypothetical protein
MTEGDRATAVGKKASVTIEAAAELVDVSAATIRHWSEVGAIEIRHVGDMEVVRLDRVHMLSQSPHANATKVVRNSALKNRLGDARIETLDVSDLQELARDREPGSAKR